MKVMLFTDTNGWSLKRSWSWRQGALGRYPEDHSQGPQRDKGALCAGNHDELIRPFFPVELGDNIEMEAKRRDFDSISYLNCGDWVESCSVILEDREGQLVDDRWIRSEMINVSTMHATSFPKSCIIYLVYDSSDTITVGDVKRMTDGDKALGC